MKTIDELRVDVSAAVRNNDIDGLKALQKDLANCGSPLADAVTANISGIERFRANDYPGALEHYTNALQIYEACGERRCSAHIMQTMGIVYAKCVNYSSALEHFKKAGDLFTEIGDTSGLASITSNIGIVHWSLGEYAEAASMYHRARDLFETVGDRRGMSKAWCNLGNVYNYTGKHAEAIDAYHHALANNEEASIHDDDAFILGNIAVAYYYAGEYGEALEYHHRCLSMAEERGDLDVIAFSLGNIGNLHVTTGNYPLALEHLHRALSIHEKHHNRVETAIVTGNIGSVYATTEQYDRALEYYERALATAQEASFRSGVANLTGKIGKLYNEKGDHAAALPYFHEALSIHEELGETKGVVYMTGSILATLIDLKNYVEAERVLASLDALGAVAPPVLVSRECARASLHEHHGRVGAAKDAFQEALNIAIDNNLPAEQAKSHRYLRDVAFRQNDLLGYVEHNNAYTEITEKINGKDTATRLAVQETELKMSAEREEHKRYLAVLHSTLPTNIVDRIARGETVSDQYEHAAVLFMDIAGFTTYVGTMDARATVTLLAEIFERFDEICDQHDVLKIKTIGDAYMAVALPSQEGGGASCEERLAGAAIEMLNSSFRWPDDSPVRFRIGLNSGPLVAGVIGTKRLQYDVWGDTVNLASRMESTGEPGKIHVSEAFALALGQGQQSQGQQGQGRPSLGHDDVAPGTWHVIPGTWHLAPRGEIEIKGKGVMTTYWLDPMFNGVN